LIPGRQRPRASRAQGKTALDLARAGKNPKIVDYLEKKIKPL
jgi:hypothetical protein